MNINERYLLDLLRTVLHGEKAPELPEGAAPEGVYIAAKNHSLSGMAFYALEETGIIQGELLAGWRQICDKALVKDITQQAELERIGNALSQAGIRWLPLKGCIIKQLYPQSDMRTMSDIDILIDEENASAARDIMLKLGYSCEHFGYDIHDIYYMQPVMNVEIHRALFGEEGGEFRGIFRDPWAMCTNDGMRYDFCKDEFFAYILAHAVKHIEEGGTGIRTIMDLWICVHSDMDIDSEKSLGLLEPSGKSKQARLLLELSEVWFGERQHSSQTEQLEGYILGSGTYGTVENSAKNRISQSGRAGYFLKLIFPTYEHMRQHYPVLKKAPVLLPFCWFARLVTKPFINRSQNAAKLRTILKK